MFEDKKVVCIGAGAIGASVGAWIAAEHDHVYFLDVGEIADVMKRDGIVTYQGKQTKRQENRKSSCD